VSSGAPRLALRAAAGLACLLALSACGGSGPKPASCGACTAQLGQIRADTYASVAARIYRQEVEGAANRAAYAHIARLTRLLRGLDAGDLALARRALASQSAVRHAVRARVVDDARVLVDVGLPFVIAGAPRPLLAADGRVLGDLEVSIQDVVGFVKLITRLTGTRVVVRGSVDGHVVSTLPAAVAAGVTLPASGPVTIGARRYVVSSLARPGFGGEQLRMWLLDPA
jgi:hypothetical protein